MNYYELFNFKIAPKIDKTLVAKKYFELQKRYHPDFYTLSTESEKEEALLTSAQINKAYKIFKDSDQTLAYYLTETGTILPDEKYNLPPDFLMEVMDFNEAIDQNPEQANIQINDFINQLNEPVKHLLDADNTTAPTAEELQQLKIYYYKKKYLHRILDRLKG